MFQNSIDLYLRRKESEISEMVQCGHKLHKKPSEKDLCIETLQIIGNFAKVGSAEHHGGNNYSAKFSIKATSSELWNCTPQRYGHTIGGDEPILESLIVNDDDTIYQIISVCVNYQAGDPETGSRLKMKVDTCEQLLRNNMDNLNQSIERFNKSIGQLIDAEWVRLDKVQKDYDEANDALKDFPEFN